MVSLLVDCFYVFSMGGYSIHIYAIYIILYTINNIYYITHIYIKLILIINKLFIKIHYKLILIVSLEFRTTEFLFGVIIILHPYFLSPISEILLLKDTY